MAISHEGIHVVKIQRNGRGFVCSIPKEIAEELGLLPGAGFLSVRAIGECIVISQAKDVSPEGLPAEADENFRNAMAAFEAAHFKPKTGQGG